MQQKGRASAAFTQKVDRVVLHRAFGLPRITSYNVCYTKLLRDLCRFRSSLRDGWISLSEYLEAMPEGQDAIYYLTGDSVDALKANPQIEGFTAKGVEVLLLTDTIDEFWTSMAPPYKDRRFASVALSGGDLAKIAAKADAPEAEDKPADDSPTAEADIHALALAMQEIFGPEVKAVKASERLTSYNFV